MKIKKMPGGDFLVHIDADLRSLAERKMFVAVGKDGVPQHPEMIPILVKLGRANRVPSGSRTAAEPVVRGGFH